ncbi:pseudouridine synthase [Sistotremastrum suecicum HHB10207 ss-3]|uniref:Pseudouridine synthase n=1 Tax=Sistotremastrum suecicum HHB10207 ss-3 TaxID=1314776 RepID=A0A166BLL7_9AGAM|nr:pseudouridine synthase [Sistotremastrum suecicum HHB10207 ss-3]
MAASADDHSFTPPKPAVKRKAGLKKIPSYWHPYITMAKGRWYGREILEMVSTEFRDRSLEYYRYALESGVTTLNGKIALPGTIIQNGDILENIVHRHEPPVTDIPIRILHEVPGEYIVIDKPGSIPVHSTGRYHRQSLVETLKNEFGYPKIYTVNRLDRLTSGLMILALSSSRARGLTEEFTSGTIRKEYIARCRFEFPAETVICEEPLLTVDRQMGLNIVHPEGKPAKTIFNRMFYDAATDTSVLHCQPLTGRSHQIRVHLQYLGYPIANDPIYSSESIWGKGVGKGGLSSVPSDLRAPPVPPAQLRRSSPPPDSEPTAREKDEPDTLPVELSSETPQPISHSDDRTTEEATPRPKLLPRETGEDIGMGSPVPLSSEAVEVITKLRNMKDEEDDWSRWRDVIFRAKSGLVPQHVCEEIRARGKPRKVQQNMRKTFKDRQRGIVTFVNDTASSSTEPSPTTTLQAEREQIVDGVTLAKNEAARFCPECYLPLHPDPDPEKLYIFLHALRYTTKTLGAFETEMPHWAVEGFTW